MPGPTPCRGKRDKPERPWPSQRAGGQTVTRCFRRVEYRFVDTLSGTPSPAVPRLTAEPAVLSALDTTALEPTVRHLASRQMAGRARRQRRQPARPGVPHRAAAPGGSEPPVRWRIRAADLSEDGRAAARDERGRLSAGGGSRRGLDRPRGPLRSPRGPWRGGVPGGRRQCQRGRHASGACRLVFSTRVNGCLPARPRLRHLTLLPWGGTVGCPHYSSLVIEPG